MATVTTMRYREIMLFIYAVCHHKNKKHEDYNMKAMTLPFMSDAEAERLDKLLGVIPYGYLGFLARLNKSLDTKLDILSEFIEDIHAAAWALNLLGKIVRHIHGYIVM